MLMYKHGLSSAGTSTPYVDTRELISEHGVLLTSLAPESLKLTPKDDNPAMLWVNNYMIHLGSAVMIGLEEVQSTTACSCGGPSRGYDLWCVAGDACTAGPDKRKNLVPIRDPASPESCHSNIAGAEG